MQIDFQAITVLQHVKAQLQRFFHNNDRFPYLFPCGNYKPDLHWTHRHRHVSRNRLGKYLTEQYRNRCGCRSLVISKHFMLLSQWRWILQACGDLLATSFVFLYFLLHPANHYDQNVYGANVGVDWNRPGVAKYSGDYCKFFAIGI